MTELGPQLGRLTAPPNRASPAEALLGPARLALLTGVFERAGWMPGWERAVGEAQEVVSTEISTRLLDAARISRYPDRRLRQELPAPEDRAMLAARFSAAGIGYEEAVARLAESGRDEDLRRVCGELEAAWDRLVAVADLELERAEARAAGIRAWKRPWTPLLAGASLLLVLAGWLGLVLGGYLAVPGWLRPLALWVWSR